MDKRPFPDGHAMASMFAHDAGAVFVRAKVLAQHGRVKQRRKELSRPFVSRRNTGRPTKTEDVRGFEFKSTGQRGGKVEVELRGKTYRFSGGRLFRVVIGKKLLKGSPSVRLKRIQKLAEIDGCRLNLRAPVTDERHGKQAQTDHNGDTGGQSKPGTTAQDGEKRTSCARGLIESVLNLFP